ncbi:methylenetetrahydrofolate reduct [Ramicandelaber brevisporus]|nr:methylenetetrahydrofolate reduct [Ramicandelaber brevisporus]
MERKKNSTLTSWSFEFFPPKTEAGQANLYDRIGRMSSTLSPLFVSVTWGAGGTTAAHTLEICATIQQLYGVNACLHLTCTNMSKEMIDNALVEAKEAGIKNILALRGDPPREEQEYWNTNSHAPKAKDNDKDAAEFSHAIDLVKYIRSKYPDDTFCVGVAGYPESHPESSSAAADLAHLKAKVDAGADFIISQLCYSKDALPKWIEACRSVGISVPIIAGVMPIHSYQLFRRTANLCKVNVPTELLDALEPVKNDDRAVKDIGANYVADLIRYWTSIDKIEARPSAIHFGTLNLEAMTKRILVNELGWVKQPHQQSSQQLQQSIQPQQLSQQLLPPGMEQRDMATYDDFPNGRWGDPRSPAYGELDGYGISLKVPPTEAVRLWGSPVDVKQISTLFKSFLQGGNVTVLPWCDEPLAAESTVLIPWLVELADRGILPISSQPAVDGAKSTDPVYGWGPSGGRIYQKAYIEFFTPHQHSHHNVSALLAKLDADPQVTYYAASNNGQFRTNLPDPQDVQRHHHRVYSNSANATTLSWGVFPASEIIQPTMIDQASFKSWADEAFAIWYEWSRLFAPGTAAREFMVNVAVSEAIGDNEWWLINIVHHDFRQGDGIQSLL